MSGSKTSITERYIIVVSGSCHWESQPLLNFELNTISCKAVAYSDSNAVCIRLKQFTWRLIAILSGLLIEQPCWSKLRCHNISKSGILIYYACTREHLITGHIRERRASRFNSMYKYMHQVCMCCMHRLNI